jgi:hypothetical protein
MQADAKLSSQWGATLQVVASAPRSRDDGYEAKVRWAFLSFRPDNEWLFRVGRVRPPFFINTQNSEVGVTYDQARLPVEVYSTSPIYDFDGGALTKSWTLNSAEINLDAYWGKSDIKFRLPFQRDPTARTSAAQLSEAVPSEQYIAEKITAGGLVLTHTAGSLVLRGGVHRATLKLGQAIPETYVPIAFPAPPPFDGTLYTPTNFLAKINVNVLILGADWRSGDWRVTGEYGQRFVTGTKLGVDSKSGYVTVARSIGKWTPYVTHARLQSGSDTRDLYFRLNSTPVPLGAQGPPLQLPATLHRTLADTVFVYDQYSTMLGASYSFSATSKIKFEWMRTHVGLASALIDAEVRNKSINVFSMSYSVAF